MKKIILLLTLIFTVSTYLYALTFDNIQKSCIDGNRTSCNSLAVMYEEGNGTKKNISKAIEIYQKLCDSSFMKGCSNLGRVMYDGTGTQQNFKQAVKLFQKSCNGGFAGGCYNLGLAYHEGKGVSKDIAKSIDIYQKNCNNGHASSCTNLGGIYINEKLIKQNTLKGINLYKKGCELGNYRGCTNLGAMYYNGEYIQQDINKAQELFKKACENGDDDGCYNYTLVSPSNNQMINPIDFQNTKENKEKVISFIEKVVKDKNPTASASILRMLEKHELTSFKYLTTVNNKKLLNKIIDKECSPKSCPYGIVKMLYNHEVKALKEKLSW